MAKINYKIPVSLARSLLDHEIVLSGGGFSSKPIAMKVILFWLASVLAMFWLLTNSFFKHADFWLLAAIAIWWLIATAFLGKYSKTKELNVRSVKALIDYLPKSSRRVNTRSTADASGLYSIVGIDDITDEGAITWNDGSVGRAYLVVGSASILVFAQDKLAILDRVDNFWRKVDTTYEVISVTTKEPQRVYRQLANLDRRNLELKVNDPDLDELNQELYAILTGYVGDSFTSIHQYFMVKADNLEALRRADTVLRAESEESALMIKQLTQLNGDETNEMLRSVYTGGR